MIIKVRVVENQAELRRKVLLNQFRSRVFLNDRNYIEVGRGSNTVLERLSHIEPFYENDCILSVGDFCEFAACNILVGGSHKLPTGQIKYTFNSTPIVGKLVKNNAQSIHYDQTIIGSGCIISFGCVVLAGAEIGPQSIVGAHSLVPAKNYAPLSVLAGSPAQKISSLEGRFFRLNGHCETSVFELRLDALIKYLDGVSVFSDSDLSNDRCRISYVAETVKGRIVKIEINGVFKNDEFIPLAGLSGVAARYFSQLKDIKSNDISITTDLEDILF